MSMAKDQSILDLVALLELSAHVWTTVDNWEADFCAVGIATTSDFRRLVYVSTFDLPPGRYNYECEAPSGPSPEDYATIRSGNNVDFDTLQEVIEAHLGG